MPPKSVLPINIKDFFLKNMNPSAIVQAAAYQKQQYQQCVIEVMGHRRFPEEVAQKMETVKSTIDALQEIADELKTTYDRLMAEYDRVEARCQKEASEAENQTA